MTKGAGVKIWGWDKPNKKWVPILVNEDGKLIIDPTEIFEDEPTDNEMGKAPTSNWAHDHEALPDIHHNAPEDDSENKEIVFQLGINDGGGGGGSSPPEGGVKIINSWFDPARLEHVLVT
ncbi:hypothetical protein ES708_09886 [subsurface metagenome]